ncbi:MAG: hypothetical protein JWO30_1554 [Fibrobacteres bacterium]|nr:hypothetical protein [Fibrobacterota bacterium]
MKNFFADSVVAALLTVAFVATVLLLHRFGILFDNP